jgi:hypothetical protein
MSTTRDSGLVKMGSAFRLPSTKNALSAPPDADSSFPTVKDGAQASRGSADFLPVDTDVST